MDDLISRQKAIDALADMHCKSDEDGYVWIIRSDAWARIDALPSAQPEKRTEERTKTHSCDSIDREAAVDAIYHHLPSVSRTRAQTMLHEVPSAQPETHEKRTETHACDLISRQEAIEVLAKFVPYAICDASTESYTNGLTDAYNLICQLPSAQPERKKGEWLRYGEDGYPNNEDTVFWQCDQCLEQYAGRTERIPNFCPNCGADMRGEQDDESRSKSNAQTDTRARGMGTADKSSGI